MGAEIERGFQPLRGFAVPPYPLPAAPLRAKQGGLRPVQQRGEIRRVQASGPQRRR